MKKILKKSLACMLAAILCLTACVGAMATVGAEGAITYAITDVTVNQGEKTVIDVAISNFADVAGLIAEITVPDAVKSIDSVKLNDTVELVAIGETAGHYIVDGKTVKFVGLFNSLNEFGDAFATVDALEINIAVTIAADAEGEYSFAAPVFQAGTANEEILAVNGNVGKLTVKKVCTHTDVTTVQENVVEATCYAEGSYDEVVKCSCGYVVSSTPKTIAKIAHTPAEAVVENNVDATCYAEGSYDSVVYCSVEACKAEISRTPVTVGKTEHTPAEAVVENNVDATCYAEGSYDSVVYCSVEACKHEISRTPVTVEKIAHTPAEAVKENEVAAQPGVAGSYDSVVYCSVEACKAEISRTPVEIPALPVGPQIDLEFDTSLRFIVGIAETVGVNVVFTKPEKYDTFKVKINRNAFDNSYNYTPAAEIVWEAKDAYSSNELKRQYAFRYRDIPLYAMSEKIVFTFEGYEDGVLTGISNPYEWRLDEFVASYVNASSTAENTRELYSEVLWLGEYAHRNFKASAAANAAIQKLDSPVALISTQPIADYVIPDVTKEVSEGESVKFNRTMVGVTTAPSFKVVMGGMTDDVRNNATFTATHTSKLLTPNEQVFTHALNVSDSLMMISGVQNAYTHSGIALYDGDKLIEFKIEKDGVVLAKYTTSLAIETYQAMETAKNGGKIETAEMYERVLILGETARRCFNG